MTERRLALVAAICASLVAALAVPGQASAHAYLVRSTPPAGSRLALAPEVLVLYFSEPFVRSSERIAVRRFGGATLSLPAPESRGTVVRQPLPPGLKGIYIVSWRVLSDDGHLSAGELAFASRASGPLPALQASSPSTPWSQVVASWLFFLGVAFALGGLVSERTVWRGAAKAPVVAASLLAALAAFAELVFLSRERSGGGWTAGLGVDELRQVLTSRPGVLTLVALAGAGIAAALASRPRLRLLAILPLLAAVVATALRSHSGTSGRWWAVPANAVHLAGAALWVGALAQLVLVIARSSDRREKLAEAARRYSRLALPTVLVVLAAGLLTALAEFRHVGDLADTSYGRTLLVKSGLIALALALAASARRWALPDNPHPRLWLLRRFTASEVTALVAVLGAAALLANLAPPRNSAAGQLPQLGPPPLSGRAVRLADMAGQLVVALAAGERELQFTVLRPTELSHGKIELTAEAKQPDGKHVDLYPRSCGDGCISIRFRLQPGTTVVTARVASPDWQGGEARFAIPSPVPAEQPAQLRRVTRTMSAVAALELTEAVTSGPSSSARPAGYSLSGRAFMATELYRRGAVDVRPLRREGGLTQLVFALPGSDVWYRLWIDGGYRLRRELIISRGHRISRTFTYPRQRLRSAPGGVTTSSRGSRPPPDAPLTLAAEADDLAVGLAARPTAGHLVLTATVLGPDGGGAEGLRLAFRVRAAGGVVSTPAVPCGPGCYRAAPPVSGRPRVVLVELQRLAHAPAILRFVFPTRWPPRSATALVRRATAVYRGLRTLVIHERLASSALNVVRTTWRIEAPDKLTYQIAGGASAIVVGGRRWDRDPGGSWQPSQISPLTQPAPTWGSAPRHAALLGSGRVNGRPVWLVSFVQSDIPAWFRLAIDKRTLRTLDLRMVAAAHFMHHGYSDFDAPLTIAPPGG